MSSTPTSLTAHHVRAAETTPPPPARPRFAFLDGVRGITAVYVALFHAVGYAGYRDTLATGLSAPGRLIASLLSFGTYAVPVFIVLSGFSLMLPLAQRGTTTIPGGAPAYLIRRAWRILPAYYIALAFTLALIALFPILQTPQNTAWDTKIPITPAAIIAHLTLFHDLSPQWIYKINGPMWSVAVEWHIYFLFPALLLPILRRSNIVVTVAAAMLVGMLPSLILPNQYNLYDAHPWFLGLFAMGMAAALLTYTTQGRTLAYLLRFQRALTFATLALAAGTLAAVAVNPGWMEWHAYVGEAAIGLVVAYWLFRYATAARRGDPPSPWQRALESRPLMTLGAFSYSIYLIHNPIQALVNLWTLSWPMSADLRMLLMLCIATPIAVAVAYGFYLVAERPFLRLKDRSAARAERA